MLRTVDIIVYMVQQHRRQRKTRKLNEWLNATTDTRFIHDDNAQYKNTIT